MYECDYRSTLFWVWENIRYTSWGLCWCCTSCLNCGSRIHLIMVDSTVFYADELWKVERRTALFVAPSRSHLPPRYGPLNISSYVSFVYFVIDGSQRVKICEVSPFRLALSNILWIAESQINQAHESALFALKEMEFTLWITPRLINPKLSRLSPSSMMWTAMTSYQPSQITTHQKAFQSREILAQGLHNSS